ncbi:hypothetical protein TARUN_7903 [Trichoderma arundinaceum]|uniref:C2 domain-containing protein n=1 Tax=Trichoderma arundinaceum TaxID=490622 RepID=A0A395NEG6_TRIAR|nr:hypothetical protein TARUN_7903 [Trichoderma arundinaceum]
MEVSNLLPSKNARGSALASLLQPTMAMSTASKSFALNGPHTAGLFADMSVDGPVIGTLVAIVDRAKNLPNRKTIGKQDPYCAARLGKEAKKTATDVRGGQTPKWDQELRFTVHDSADYYQLKISVFTDDKKTDLIGESWIDLKGIIIPGGGQNDVWQTLTCRGKYAGEIRLEITFYDTRPKPDKPAARPRYSMGAELENSSPKRKEMVKRRPLPTDPVTGEVTANVPGQAPPSDYHQPPSRPPVKPNSQSPYGSNHSLHETVEYGTPIHGSTRSRHADHFSSHSPGTLGHSGSGRVEGPRQPRPTRQDSYERERGYSQKIPVSPYEQHDPRGSSYSLASDGYEMAPADDSAQYSPHGGSRQAAPPPPAHRSRHSTSQEGLQRRSDEHSPQRAIPPVSMRSDVLKNEAHRNTTPTYPGRPQFRPYDPTMQSQPPIQKAITYEPHNSYDAYDAQYRSMQPTVEDVPESPTGSMRNRPRRSSSRIPPLDEIVYDNAPIPIPTGLSRSPGGGSSGFLSQSPGAYPTYQEQPRNPNSVSPLSARDYTESPGQMTQYSYSSQSQRPHQQREHETTYIQSSPSYGLPALPPSLAPGVDPNMAQEMSNRAYEERRHDGRYNNQMISSAVPRDRHRSDPPPPSHEPAFGTSPQPYDSYDRRRSGAFGGGPDPHAQHAQGYRDASPNPQHKIRRKSVSPAPPPSDHRRHSDIPFSPDSYDAFNPGVSSRDGSPGLDQSEPPSKILTHDGREIDPSDHLPVESWAPEPEAKPSQQEPAQSRTRPPLSGAQPMPPSGRRPLRISMARTSQAMVPSNAYGYSEGPRAPPAQGGRQRLQKKAQRHSMGPTTSAPNPLSPITPDNFQDRPNQYSSTRSRAGAWDYPNENYAPPYNGGNQGPPIPAKVPLPIMSGANGGAEDMALIQEMQKIDIGTGRSRRRGGY